MALVWNRYGKARVRLVKVERERDPHELRDLTIDVQLEGAFDAVYVEGDNTSCLATDTMKNTVYALARLHPVHPAEAFAQTLAAHFATKPAVSSVRIQSTEQRWARLSADGRPHPHAFMQEGPERYTVAVVRSGERVEVTAGLSNLVVLKTTDSEFAGFPRDRYTTLPDTHDRILCTSVEASWTYTPGTTNFDVRDDVRRALLSTFAVHQSRSVQHTLYAMAEAALAASASIAEITMRLPNRHHLLVDLAPFGLDNPNTVFVATDEPYGLIEATVRRTT